MSILHPRVYRLIVLHKLLRAGGKVNAPKILKHPAYEDMNRKTVIRDIRQMREDFGAPVGYNRNEKSYFYTDQNYSFTIKLFQIWASELSRAM